MATARASPVFHSSRSAEDDSGSDRDWESEHSVDMDEGNDIEGDELQRP